MMNFFSCYPQIQIILYKRNNLTIKVAVLIDFTIFIKVSMIGPSPDWIVGVSGLELCQKNCTWLESKELFLYPWDAGVDSGISYESPDKPTDPPQNITR